MDLRGYLYRAWQKSNDVESKKQYLSRKQEAERIVLVAIGEVSKEIVIKLEEDGISDGKTMREESCWSLMYA